MQGERRVALQISIEFLEKEQKVVEVLVNVIHFLNPGMKEKRPDNHPPVKFVYLETKDHRKEKNGQKTCNSAVFMV